MAAKITVAFTVACCLLSATFLVGSIAFFVGAHDVFSGWIALVVGVLFGVAAVLFNVLYLNTPPPRKKVRRAHR